MPGENYIAVAQREFRRYKVLADNAMKQLSDEQFFDVLDNADNSVAIIVKHMAGNMRSRWRDFLATDGEKTDRNRDAEFELDGSDTREALTAAWEAGWGMLFDALGPLREKDLIAIVTIRGESLTALQAINRQLTHYVYHVGQIVLIAKHLAAEHWQTLSVPKGGSVQYNASPPRYLDGE